MGHPLIARRSLLGGAGTAALLSAARLDALGRTPVGGKLALVIPWGVGRIDPHDLFDPAAALFASALFDPLYQLDTSSEPYPTLASDLPTTQGNKTLIRLREGLLTAKGARVDAQDVAFSLQRARRNEGQAWWTDLPAPALVAGDPLALTFATRDGARLARALASPLFAVVPRGFDPTSPDGTGSFAAALSTGRLALRRNLNAARGGAFLDEVVVDQAPDLASSLRSFEGNLADLGWLGSGLHAPRPGAEPFDLGGVGWIVLHAGNEAGAWGGAGNAQRLLDGIPAERLSRFGLSAPARTSGPPPTSADAASTTGAGWGAKPADLLVQEGSAYLEELGRTLSSLLSRPSHEITVKTLPYAEFTRRRASGAFSLLLGVVRPFANSGISTFAALLAAENPAAAGELMKHPPQLTSFVPKVLARTQRLGVVGELRVLGARAPDVHLAQNPSGGWDLGSTYRSTGT